jgi:hypothetical protein
MSLSIQWLEKGEIRDMQSNGMEAEYGAKCRDSDGILFLAGSGRTNVNGRWEFRSPSSSALCFVIGRVKWISLVATPSRKVEKDAPWPPDILTTLWEPSGDAFILYVYSWDCGKCLFKPDVEFSYHAVIAYEPRE